MQRFTIVGLGEVLWDMFPDGARFGGAPANFACHAAMLGGDAYVVSQVGHDDLGARAIAALHGHGVHTDFVTSSPDRPTGTVQVTLDPQGKPAFAIGADAAWDALAWTDRMSELAGRADAVCFGTLGQRSPAARATIRQFLDAIRPDCLGIFDVNLRPPYYDGQLILDSLARANALKLNDDELPIVAGIAGVHGDDRAVLVGLRDRYDLRFVALTRGARGATLLAGDRARDFAAPAVAVKDTVGAGDAFTAALALDWLRGRDLEAIGRHATAVAAYVCSQAGATPSLPADLRG